MFSVYSLTHYFIILFISHMLAKLLYVEILCANSGLVTGKMGSISGRCSDCGHGASKLVKKTSSKF